MTEKKATGFIIEIFVVLSVLGILAAIALPNIGQMIDKSRAASADTEFHNIQIAVVEMLYESSNRTLVPVGPTADMNDVLTSDTPPLVLTDYLLGRDSGLLTLGCMYSFTADGTVTQTKP